MSDNKELITNYLNALSGKPKTAELTAQYIDDPNLLSHIAHVEAAFPAYEIITDDMLAEGDKVVVRGTFRGVHRGSFAGVEPTGRSVSAGLLIIYKIAGSRIADHWMQFDLFGLLQQLQEAPAAAQAR